MLMAEKTPQTDREQELHAANIWYRNGEGRGNLAI